MKNTNKKLMLDARCWVPVQTSGKERGTRNQELFNVLRSMFKVRTGKTKGTRGEGKTFNVLCSTFKVRIKEREASREEKEEQSREIRNA